MFKIMGLHGHYLNIVYRINAKTLYWTRLVFLHGLC